MCKSNRRFVNRAVSGKRRKGRQNTKTGLQLTQHCTINHSGSAGKMETDAIVEMFQRSEELHNMNYSNYVGDGDAKTFRNVVESKPYGDDHNIVKKECINHVQKRMGNRLRNLKKTKGGLGGKGKLTGVLIDKLSLYYGLATRGNIHSAKDMKKEIWATYYHITSTDKKPQHQNCPVGETSWCKRQKAKALGKLKGYKHEKALPENVAEAIKPIYEQLSNDDLLDRCVGGFNQNSNESFNAVIWDMAPKTITSNADIVNIASNIAVCKFNDGMKRLLNIVECLGVSVGPNMFNYATEQDEKRVQRSEAHTRREMSSAENGEAKQIRSRPSTSQHSKDSYYALGMAD